MPHPNQSSLKYFSCVWWAVLGDKGAHLLRSVVPLVFLLLISEQLLISVNH